MILPMSKVRVLGERARLDATVRALQDLGSLHLTHPVERTGITALYLSPAEKRERRYLLRILDDAESALAGLEVTRPPEITPPAVAARVRDFARWARLARRVRRQVERLRTRLTELEEERALLSKYREFFSAFESILQSDADLRRLTAYHVVLRPQRASTVEELRRMLEEAVDTEFELRTQPLPGGELALLLLVPSQAAERVERLFVEAGVEEVPVPTSYGGSLAEAIPRMLRRVHALPTEIEQARQALRSLAAHEGRELLEARQALHDRLETLDAQAQASTTSHAFVIEGWIPTGAIARLREHLLRRLGETVVVEEVTREEWEGEPVPVVLRNPRLFRPFEALIRIMPLPSYGSIDPTPFVAVFFPMFFGLILGDAGYGAILAVIALLLHRGAEEGSMRQSISEIAGACALFTIAFGLLYGEVFGDLGHNMGLHPLWFDRAEAIIPFLGLALALGVVHMVLGLVLGVISAFRGRHPRQALGRGTSAAIVLLITVALLASFGLLPKALFTPAVVAVLVLFPLLVFAEGILAPIELLSTLSHILSYARIMAVGIASVMLAVVANRFMGSFGSVLVGTLFALLFHLVNFILGMFSPTIHSLRLHYVEFFGNFYSPGGVQYRPFGRWSPKAKGT